MNDDKSNDTVYLNVRVVKRLDASLLLEVDNGDVFVCPVSQLRGDYDVDEAGDEGSIGIPRWLAEDRGLETVESEDEL